MNLAHFLLVAAWPLKSDVREIEFASDRDWDSDGNRWAHEAFAR